MKKILSVLLLTVCLITMGFSAEAKTTKGSKAKARTTQTVKVRNNAEGYPDPTGHAYQVTWPGGGMKYTFSPDCQMRIEIKGYHGQNKTDNVFWVQNGYEIYLYNDRNGAPIRTLVLTKNGRVIYVADDNAESLRLKIVK